MTRPVAWTRRQSLAALAALPAGIGALAASGETRMLTRAIPATGELLPVIGLGTYRVFDVAGTAAEIESRLAVLRALLAAGGCLIDSSPMYNRAESVIGEVLAAGGLRERCFLATKVWTDGRAAGQRQMQRSADRMQTAVIDLMQVHNRRDLEEHLPLIREWQADGRIRYNGVTDYTSGALAAMERILREHRPQFVQINYSLGEREAEDRLLPLAADLGVAVLVNRPFMQGELFAELRRRPLPDWAADFAGSWGQFLLKYIVAHPAVTCVIPATSNVNHMIDNAGAGHGKLPDADQRRRMVEFIGGI